jgi:hypothetical protein
MLKSIHVDGAINPFHTNKYDYLIGAKSFNQTVSALNGTRTIFVNTMSSNLTDFRFDEDQKRISFKVSGEHGTEGETSVLVGNVLNPHTLLQWIDSLLMAMLQTTMKQQMDQASQFDILTVLMK